MTPGVETQPVRPLKGRATPRAPVADIRYPKWKGYGRLFVADAASVLFQSLRNQTRLCYLVLLSASYENEGRLVRGLSQNDIAGLLACSRRSVRKCLDELEVVGLIERHRRWGWVGKDPRRTFRRPGHVENHYLLRLPSEVCPVVELPPPAQAEPVDELVPVEVPADMSEAAKQAEQIRQQEQLAAEAQVRGLTLTAGAARQKLLGYAQRIAALPHIVEPLGALRFRYCDLCSGALTARQNVVSCWRAVRTGWLAVQGLTDLAEGLKEPPRDALGRPTWTRALTDCRATLALVEGVERLIAQTEAATRAASDGWMNLLALRPEDRPRPVGPPQRTAPRRPETHVEFDERAELASEVDEWVDWGEDEPRARWTPPPGVKATERQWTTWESQWFAADEQAHLAPDVARRVQKGLMGLGYDPGWPGPKNRRR